MACFESISGYQKLLDPLMEFRLFMYETYNQTTFGNEDEHPPMETCHLDYMFVWLVEDYGALHCPTFEDWLLTVIRFADYVFWPNPEGVRSDEGSNDRTYLAELRRSDTRMSFLDAAGSKHPALDRNVYERCRREALDRYQNQLRAQQTRAITSEFAKQ
jgi:hypothetical protein